MSPRTSLLAQIGFLLVALVALVGHTYKWEFQKEYLNATTHTGTSWNRAYWSATSTGMSGTDSGFEVKKITFINTTNADALVGLYPGGGYNWAPNGTLESVEIPQGQLRVYKGRFGSMQGLLQGATGTLYVVAER